MAEDYSDWRATVAGGRRAAAKPAPLSAASRVRGGGGKARRFGRGGAPLEAGRYQPRAC